MVDTGKVKNRRQLRFHTIGDLLADVERIVESDRAGRLSQTGNWSAGQIFGHLATWMNYAYEGYPIRPPWFIRFLLRMKKKKFLRDGMPAGVRIPGAPGGTFGTEALSTDEGAGRLREALQRLESGEPVKFDSPAWGPMTNAERIGINLRHAELHLSFLDPDRIAPVGKQLKT